MTSHQNAIVSPADLPEPRGWTKRLRHFRRDFVWRRKFTPPSALPAGTSDPACPNFAVGAIAVSSKYVDWCLTMIETLRGNGGYTGPVYVVTDQSAAFADLDNVFAIEVPYSRVRLLSKSLKPMLFAWIPYRYVAYIDADVAVTGTIADWYQRALVRLSEVDSPLLTYEVNNPVPKSFHGGLLFAERETALDFMKQWLKMLRSGRYLSDQAAMRRIATPTTPAYYRDADFCYLYQLLNGEVTAKPMFVHVTNRMILDHPPQALKAYLRDELSIHRLPEHFGAPESQR